MGNGTIQWGLREKKKLYVKLSFLIEQVRSIVSLANLSFTGREARELRRREMRLIRKPFVCGQLVHVQVADHPVPESITGVQRQQCPFPRHTWCSRINMAVIKEEALKKPNS